MKLTVKDYSHNYICWFYDNKLTIADLSDYPFQEDNMSNEHKLNWLVVVVLIVLISMIGYLVAVNGVGGAENGLECIYNCSDYEKVLKTL